MTESQELTLQELRARIAAAGLTIPEQPSARWSASC